MSEVPPLADFLFIMDTSLQNFYITCQPLNSDLLVVADQVRKAFETTRDLITYGLINPEPEKDHHLMIAYTEAIRDVVDSKVKVPQEYSNHLATIKEAVIALGFMTVKPAPTQFCRDMLESSDYYSNRILTQYKGIEKHVVFVTKVRELFVDLLKYVKQHHLTGFAWNSCNKSALQAAGAFPPPPPPPPPAFMDPVATGDGARIALLNQLNQGSGITSCLRPVRGSGDAVAPVREGLVAKSPVSGKPAPKTYPPKFMLDGRKWLVEHQKDNVGLVIDNENMSESVACYKMENSNLEVKGKVNNVVIDSCKKSSISLKSVIASVELIRCDRVTIVCNGAVPLINLENSESVQIFLSSKSRGVEIVSAKCSSCNVCLLDDDGTYKELPMVEQIKTVLIGEKLISTVIEKN